LTIDDCQLSIPKLECLLSLTPSLAHLKLVSSRSTLDPIFDGSYWEQFIQNKLLLLNKFQFFFTDNTYKSHNSTTLDSLILPFQSPFWLNNKHWFVTCDYIPRESKIKLYTTPVCMKVDVATRSSIFEVSLTNPKCRLILHQSKNMVCNIGEGVSLTQLSHIRMVISVSAKKIHVFGISHNLLLSDIFVE
jgi:hypothetical protein